MDDLVDIISRKENGFLQTSQIQAILLKAQTKTDLYNMETWNQTIEVLWKQLKREHDSFDDHLLCCTCFYTVLSISDQKDYYFAQMYEIIQSSMNACSEIETTCAVSLAYGIFQSSFLSKCTDIKVGETIQLIFQLLVPIAYSYSKHTFIAFKIISLFKKVLNTGFERFIYSAENKITLLNLVNHNWENPITGVRDLNRVIFSSLITVFDKNELDGIIQEINHFSWNKAKYLMLSEIIEFKQDVNLYKNNEDWIKGVIYSLEKPGLVSAGADMYFAMLKTLNNEEQWCSLFLKSIEEILKGTTRRAILNFCNYLCLTTFKRYPTVKDALLNLLEPTRSEDEHFSVICIWKQTNKLGSLEKRWDEEHFRRILTQALEASDVQTRIFAFDIICVSTSTTVPSKLECDLVIDFLTDNINTDSTVLRLNMLSSLKFFLIRIHSSFSSSHKQRKDAFLNEDVQIFCTKSQELIIDSLTLQGNYQRKITSLKLCDVFFKYFTEVPRKKQQSNTQFSLLKALKDKELWILLTESFVSHLVRLLRDPAEDIREHAMLLLLEYFFEFLQKPELLLTLTEKALEKIQDKFFYEISCGHTLFKLLLNVVIKADQNGARFPNADSIFEYAYNEFAAEFDLGRDIVKSIEAGKQLHAFLNIMSTVLNTCLKQRIRLEALENKNMNVLLTHLECISKQFASDEASSNADFSKISNIVEDTIMKSGHAIEDKDASKLSGIHQIVLNCMWLNVKETCVLASLLLKYDCNTEVSRRCLHIITNVLETSRHKGAIEAAGVALGQAIHYLTSLRKDSERSSLPLQLLQEKLGKLITDAADTASVTRRGAGYSILVHRIVSSDAQKGKPLFHYFLKTLLSSCNALEDVPSVLGDTPDVDSVKDLPKAILIHFLTRIINDSSLASDVMFYSARLAELAFDNLTSKHWQIRNAALQLYGALIPKLIGQNKQSGEDKKATVACDEFRTHSLHLWGHILRTLPRASSVDHSDLVPLVNLLASCAKRYNFKYDMQKHEHTESELFIDLYKLISSPLLTVRKLAAKCIYNIFDFQMVYNHLSNSRLDIEENAFHGCLYLTQLYHKHLSEATEMDNLKKLFVDIFNSKRRSYMSRAVFDEMFLNVDHIKLESSFAEVRMRMHEPGVNVWIKVQIAKSLQSCQSGDLIHILKLLMKENNFPEYAELFLVHLKSKTPCDKSLQQLANCLLEDEKHFGCNVTWKILYEISLKTNVVNVNNAVEYFESNGIGFRTRHILPFLAKTVTVNNAAVLKLSEVVFSLTDSEVVDCDMRFIAAITNNELGKLFSQLDDRIKMNCIKAAVVLLQDEDDDVRYMNVEFFKNVTKDRYSVQPCICLRRLISLSFLKNALSASSIPVLANDLVNLHKSTKLGDSSDDYNPFSIEANNIYKENEFTTLLVEKLQDLS